MRKNIIILLALVGFWLVATPAMAEMVANAAKAVPSMPSTEQLKQSLLAHWEVSQANNPNVAKFEKVEGGDGDYKIALNIFPYDGRLKVLNVFVAPYKGYDSDGDYHSDADEKVLYRGVIEADLPGLDKALADKMYTSYYAWKRDNRFYYDVTTGVWFNEADWDAHFAKYPTVAKASTASCIPQAQDKYKKMFLDWLPFIGLMIFLGFLVRFSRKAQKKALDAQDLMMQRQLVFLKIAEDGAVMQREAKEILAQMLAELKK